MDEKGFVEFMRMNRKSENTIKRYVDGVKAFEKYLLEYGGKRLEEATPEDMRAFASWEDQELRAINQHLWGLKVHSEYTSNETLEMVANELIGARHSAQFKLKDFEGIVPEHAKKLALKGIKTAKQMLDAGRTKEGREALAQESGVPFDCILELVKLSDLARLPGVRKIRARLYYEAGVDTVEKMADWDPEELRHMLADFIERTGFDGIAPLPKEAAATVATARHLPKIVES
jgi:hypothetical protein